RPHERGNLPKAPRINAHFKGFNGATSSRPRKRLIVRPFRAASCTLQWSHVLTNVETYVSALTFDAPYWLQWSHVLTNVETHLTRERSRNVESLQWSHVLTNVETHNLLSQRRKISLLQWSHVLTNVETRVGAADFFNARAASMEPRPHERGN